LHNVFVKFNNPITWQGNKDKKMRDIYHELVLTYKTWWIFFNSFGRHVGFGLWSTVIIKTALFRRTIRILRFNDWY